jgi:hypothetical protein
MISKIKEKKLAIKLRKQGMVYSEILRKVPVAKSTLSLWLRSVGLAKQQRQRITKLRKEAQLKGAEARRRQRITSTNEIKSKARKEIKKISKRELWLIGIALYWAEGNKEKTKSGRVRLGNTDPYLIKIFLKWLQEICKIPNSEIGFRIYLHENSKYRLDEVKKYWSKNTKFPLARFQKVTWKKHKPKTNRKNIRINYFGLLDVDVRKSTNLNRKIQGWIEGININL